MKCFYRNDDYSCRKYSDGVWYLCAGPNCPEYTMTNEERLRKMTSATLATYIALNNVNTICDIVCGGECKAVAGKDADPFSACREVVAEWLRQPPKPREATEAEWEMAVKNMKRRTENGKTI